MGIFTFSIPEGEKTLFITKAHWSSYLILWLKILAVGIFLGLVLNFTLPLWREGRWGWIGIAIFAVGALGYVIFDFWNRFLTSYIITQCRLIDITQEKFFRRTITEIDINEIEETIVKQRSWCDKIFKKGDVIIKLNEKKGVLVFYDVGNPARVQEILKNIKEETAEIIEKKGEECDVILKDDREHKIPLSYSYYGEKAKMKKGSGGLVVVEKKKSNEKQK